MIQISPDQLTESFIPTFPSVTHHPQNLHGNAGVGY